MYKLMAMDLDGTLLDSYGQISEKNKKAIKKLIDNGIEVVLSSGRPKDSVKNFAKELGAENYCICGNGALLYDLKKDQNIYTNFLDRNTALRIIKFCQKNSMYFNVYTEQFVLVEGIKHSIAVFNNENQGKPQNQQTKIKIEKDVYQFLKENKEYNVLKITISDSDKIIFDRILKRLKKMNDINALDVEHMSRKKIKVGTEEHFLEYYYTEVTGKDVNKWSAIEPLLKILNIKKEEAVTIGDNINDIEMIENAGLGIAMENGTQNVKDVANEITVSNNDSGVAEAIEKFVIK